MGLPSAPEARVFYQAAYQRHEDARALMAAEQPRTTGAVYLDGYAVECVLKALILSATPKRDRPEVLESFRGNKAHAVHWLLKQYLKAGGAAPPRRVAQALRSVATWSVELRYQPGAVRLDDSQRFRADVELVLDWADARM